MSKSDHPALSVIVMTPDRFATIRKTVKCIKEQSVQSEIELIIVAPEAAVLDYEESELRGFYHCKTVRLDTMDSMGKSKAAGIRVAAAPVIALVEEHVYPDPGWAAALIKAHEKPWAAVGPVVRNADTSTLTSWADFIITYGQWMEPLPAGAVDILPGHNSSYKRDLLLTCGEKLETMMEVEAILQQDLMSKGYHLFLEPEAVIYHLGYHRLIPSLPVQFHVGRLFAADRIKQWSFFRRLLYTGGAPLIPLVRLFRFIVKLIRSGGERKFPWAALPLTIPGLTASALGEMAGYAAGAGNSTERMIKYEFHRADQ